MPLLVSKARFAMRAHEIRCDTSFGHLEGAGTPKIVQKRTQGERPNLIGIVLHMNDQVFALHQVLPARSAIALEARSRLDQFSVRAMKSSGFQNQSAFGCLGHIMPLTAPSHANPETHILPIHVHIQPSHFGLTQSTTSILLNETALARGTTKICRLITLGQRDGARDIKYIEQGAQVKKTTLSILCFDFEHHMGTMNH
jgi:hypothetical protein